MRGDQNGSFAGHGAESGHHPVAGIQVDLADRIVEDKDPGGMKQGARQGDTLLLTAGENDALFADDRVVTVGKGGDRVVDGGLIGSRNQRPIVEIGVAEGNVLTDAAGKQEGFLRYKGQLGPEIPKFE